MAIQTPQYLNNKGYTASLDRSPWQSLVFDQEGVADLATHGLVTAAGGLTVSVSATRCFIKGDNSTNQGYYHFWSDSATTVTLNTADATNPRIDAIVARVYDQIDGGSGSDQGTLEVVTGTPNASSAFNATGTPTGAPTIPGTALILAWVLVGAGASSLSAAVIRDARQTYGISRGAVSIATAELTSATTYALTNLATPDVVRNVVLPPNGLIVVAYQAIWQNTIANNGRASIFLNTTQIKTPSGAGVPAVTDTFGPAETNDDGILASGLSAGGLISGGGIGASTEVTTGSVIGSSSASTPVYIFAAAGTYDVSVQFKNSAAGNTTVKNRHLWVWVQRF